MRRTYRSKKDGSGLDHKNMISRIDAKNSVFDAFYIQNIKLNMKEISSAACSNRINVVSKKVRKRKYVKRIVKHTLQREEHFGDSESQSVYLTPDKSIHVNKAPDPFDLLLKSSPALTESPVLFQKSPKKYDSKKKTIYYKRCNRPISEGTASEKENTMIRSRSTSHNNSDVKSHKLMVEVEEVVESKTECADESIKRIVKHLPVLSNLNKRTPTRRVKYEHRLSVTTQNSPAPAESPLCSTPFQLKCRTKSIYNISPISIHFNNSPKTFRNTWKGSSLNEVISLDENKSQSELLVSNISNEERKWNPHLDLSTGPDTSLNVEGDTISPTAVSEPNTLSTSQVEPCYSFASKSTTNEISLLATSTYQPVSQLEHPEYEVLKFSNDCLPSASSLNSENSDSIEECASQDSSGADSDGKLITVSHRGEMKKNNHFESDKCLINKTNYSRKAKLVVALEKMDDFVFSKYYEKYKSTEIDLDKSHNNLKVITDFERKQNPIDLVNVSYDKDWHKQFHCKDSYSTDNRCQVSGQSFESNAMEDGGISYVTTRRRNKIINDSIIFITDNEADETAICDSIINLTGNHKDNNASSVTEHVDTQTATTSETKLNSTGKCNRTEMADCNTLSMAKTPIVLPPGKKWERSLSIYKRMTTIVDPNHSLLDCEHAESKGRKYRQSVIDTIEMQKSLCSLHNESINGRRSTFVCKPSRSTIKIVKENRNSRTSLCSTTAYEDLKGFLSDDCDDTIVDLSKLSIGDSVHEVTVLEKFRDTGRLDTARDYVLRRCNQTEPILFDECYSDTELKNCHKIGEGVYGEVFLWRARDGEARVLKVIPIAGDIKVNGEPQKGYHEIISEIVIAMELSALRAPIADIEKHLDADKQLDAVDVLSAQNATDIFNEVLAVRCVRGAYPARLLELWELYDECRGSDNDSPAALPPAQHYLVLELRNAGRDLESYSFTGADQAHAVFLQLAFGLAVAEEALQFEHRDLHWGNVLVAPTDLKYATFVLRGRVHRVARRGVACAVIDYSLSRLSLRGAALYADLADDDSLFDAVGDRQFAVYRLMRDRLGNEWKNFEPYTNVLWLHYVADKMVTALRYERPATKLHRHHLAQLRAARARLLDCPSAAAFVLALDDL